MCIFVAPVLRVSKTRIAVAPLSDNRQLIVYENQVSQQPGARNAMVLPVPAGQPVTLVDFSKYPFGGNFWDDCDSLIPRAITNNAMSFGGGFGVATKDVETLPVQRVGAYMASVVPSLADFGRLDASVFQLPKDIESILVEHYAAGFSFVVCLFTGNVGAHPIAYTSARLPNGNCFIPTRHAHGSGFGGANVNASGQAVHANITCDVCRTKPVVGVRFKCYECDDFDMCEQCMAQRRSAHDADHHFVYLPKPLNGKLPLPGAYSGPFGRRIQEEAAPDDFDHTLYIFNAVLTASPKRYTEHRRAVISGFDLRQRPGLQFLMLPRWDCVERITIEGGNFVNADYECAPIQ